MSEMNSHRPIINPAYVPVKISSDAVAFRVGPFAGAKHTIVDDDGHGVVHRLVDYFDGQHTIEEILTNFDEEDHIINIIKKLYQENILRDADSGGTDPLWGYGTVAQEISKEQKKRFESSSVSIVTKGPLGSMVAQDLASMGVEDVNICNTSSSTTTVSNQAISSVSEYSKELFEESDYVIYATNSPSSTTALSLNKLAIETETPLTVGHVLGIEGIVGPTIIPGESACYDCLLNRWKMNTDNREEFEAYMKGGMNPVENVLLPSYNRIVAGYLSLEAMTQLLFGHGYFVGRTLDINLLTLDIETNEVLKWPRCDTCGVQNTDVQRYLDLGVSDDG